MDYDFSEVQKILCVYAPHENVFEYLYFFFRVVHRNSPRDHESPAGELWKIVDIKGHVFHRYVT